VENRGGGGGGIDPASRQIASDPDSVVACSTGDQCRDRKRRRTGAASGRRKGAVGATAKKKTKGYG